MNHFFESTRDKRTKVRDGKGGEEGDSSGNFIRVTSTVGQTTRYQASRMSTVRVPFPFPIANGSSRFFATPLDPSLWLSTTRCFLHTGKPIRANLRSKETIQGNNYTGFYSGSIAIETWTRVGDRWWERIERNKNKRIIIPWSELVKRSTVGKIISSSLNDRRLSHATDKRLTAL